MKEKLKTAIEASLSAGYAIMEIYKEDEVVIESKEDSSPLTVADKRANEIINRFLVPHEIPIISEENRQIDYEERKTWTQCWIVDPLDGTKEFIKKNDEFTVNIALIENGKPVLGVIYAPALNTLYFALVSESKAFRYRMSSKLLDINQILRNAEEIGPATYSNQLKVVGSRSHMNEETKTFIENLKDIHGDNIEIISKGSSLKFCLVAEGEAHIYPRFAPTMEWDTAAGQAICEAVGLKCLFRETGEPMTYNREELLNGHFSVSHER
jgi:3'(2'), 5'-bisphosphate nucleotidase